MSQTFFSKQPPEEKQKRLEQLAEAKGKVTLWLKGKGNRLTFEVNGLISTRQEIVLDDDSDAFPHGSEVLVSFEIRGMNYFSQVTYLQSAGSLNVLRFDKDLFKSERRNSYRLLTYPIYNIWANFNLEECYQGSNVVSLTGKSSQTALFKNFLRLIDDQSFEDSDQRILIRVQDLSTTGMAVHVGELELKFFSKDRVFKNVIICFSDEKVRVPEVKVMYSIPYQGSDKNIKLHKIGLHFSTMTSDLDLVLGKKINALLRQVDSNKDFENFLK